MNIKRFTPVFILLWDWIRDVAKISVVIGVLIFGFNIASSWNDARKQAAERESLMPDHPPVQQQDSETSPKAAIFPASLLMPTDVLSHRNPVLWI